jgi:hypothetical protein
MQRWAEYLDICGYGCNLCTMGVPHAAGRGWIIRTQSRLVSRVTLCLAIRITYNHTVPPNTHHAVLLFCSCLRRRLAGPVTDMADFYPPGETSHNAQTSSGPSRRATFLRPCSPRPVFLQAIARSAVQVFNSKGDNNRTFVVKGTCTLK